MVVHHVLHLVNIDLTIYGIFILCALLSLVGHQRIMNLYLCMCHATDAVGGGGTKLTLSIKSTELRFVLYKVILTVLQDSLIIESTNASFTFGLSVFVCIFDFLLALIHVT